MEQKKLTYNETIMEKINKNTRHCALYLNDLNHSGYIPENFKEFFSIYIGKDVNGNVYTDNTGNIVPALRLLSRNEDKSLIYNPAVFAIAENADTAQKKMSLNHNKNIGYITHYINYKTKKGEEIRPVIRFYNKETYATIIVDKDDNRDALYHEKTVVWLPPIGNQTGKCIPYTFKEKKHKLFKQIITRMEKSLDYKNDAEFNSALEEYDKTTELFLLKSNHNNQKVYEAIHKNMDMWMKSLI